MFVSQLPRDNLASVSKDALSSPGPGSYIPLDNLAKTGQKIQFQTQSRYLNNPFGCADPRFDYQKPSPRNEAPREEISVVDPEVHQRRLAYQKTAELHKKLGEIRPNAVFHSIVKRDAASEGMPLEAANSTASTFLTSMVAKPNNGNSLTLVEQKVRMG